TGCGICVTSCPGLAIFVLDMNYSDEEALIKLPYEMLPLPQKGEMVSGLDREGHKVAEVKVDKVTKTKNKTYLISIVVPKELALIIRNIRVEDKTNG
ncbi:MAG: 4Fe-4S ferredoxin, partial [Candidatus Caldatribacteriota bacterium]